MFTCGIVLCTSDSKTILAHIPYRSHFCVTKSLSSGFRIQEYQAEECYWNFNRHRNVSHLYQIVFDASSTCVESNLVRSNERLRTTFNLWQCMVSGMGLCVKEDTRTPKNDFSSWQCTDTFKRGHNAGENSFAMEEQLIFATFDNRQRFAFAILFISNLW